MADYSLSIIFKAIDKATAPIRRISSNLEEVRSPINKINLALNNLAHNPNWHKIVRNSKFIAYQLGVMADQTAKGIKSIGKSITGVGKGIEGFGQQMTLKATLPIVGLGTKAAMTAKNMKEAIGQIGTLLVTDIPDLAERTAYLEKLREGINKVAVDSARLPLDVARATYDAISYMGNSADIIEKVAVAGRFAVSGKGSIAEAMQLLMTSTLAYMRHPTAKDFIEYQDKLQTTIRTGGTTLHELGESLKMVIPLGAQLEQPINTLLGFISTLAGVSGETNMVVTELAAVFTAFLRGGGGTQGTKMMEAIKFINEELGTAYQSGAELMKDRGWMGALDIFAKITTGKEHLFTAILGGRKEALMGALAISGKQAGRYAERLEAINNAAGEGMKAFAEMTEGINSLGFRMTQTNIRFKVFLQYLGDLIMEDSWFKKTLDTIDKLFISFSNLGKGTQKFIIKVLAAIAVLGPLGLIVGLLVRGFGNLISYFGFFTKAVFGTKGLIAMALANPIAALIILLTTVAGIAIWKNWDKGPDKSVFTETKTKTEKLLDVVRKSWEEFKKLFNLNEAFDNISQRIKEIPQDIRDALAEIKKMFTSLDWWPEALKRPSYESDTPEKYLKQAEEDRIKRTKAWEDLKTNWKESNLFEIIGKGLQNWWSFNPKLEPSIKSFMGTTNRLNTEPWYIHMNRGEQQVSKSEITLYLKSEKNTEVRVADYKTPSNMNLRIISEAFGGVG